MPCINCNQPFAQPHYYYGQDPGKVYCPNKYCYSPTDQKYPLLGDTFLCNVCSLKGVADSTPNSDREIQHVSTHSLVRVQDRIEDPVLPLPPTVDERIMDLEQRVSNIDFKLDRLEGRLDELITSQSNLETRLNNTFTERFSHIENLLVQLLGSSATAERRASDSSW